MLLFELTVELFAGLVKFTVMPAVPLLVVEPLFTVTINVLFVEEKLLSVEFPHATLHKNVPLFVMFMVRLLPWLPAACSVELLFKAHAPE